MMTDATDIALLTRVIEALDGYQQLGNEVWEADGAVFCRNRGYPRRHDANYVTRVQASSPAEIDSLLARVEAEYAGFTHRRIDTDFRTPPPFAARLVVEGWKPSDGLCLLLEGDLKLTSKPADCEIHLVQSEDDWRQRQALMLQDWAESSARNGAEFDGTLGEPFVAALRAKQPHARHWMACVDGAPAAFFSSWPGTDGVGQVEDLFTHPAYRKRGIATALIAHCVADARARGARDVAITADPNDTPKRLYAAMGFRPLMTMRAFNRDLSPPPARA